jgi:hypothetical protein
MPNKSHAPNHQTFDHGRFFIPEFQVIVTFWAWPANTGVRGVMDVAGEK